MPARSRRTFPLLTASVAVALMAAPREAASSPVNDENLRLDTTNEGWMGSLDSRASGSRGNIDRLDVGYGAGAQWRTHHPPGVGFGRYPVAPGSSPFFRDRWLFTLDGGLVRIAGNTFLNRGFAHTRYTRMWLPRLGSDVFLQGQYDQITRLKLRVVGGVGARVDLVHRRVPQLWLGTGYMPEYEVNDTLEGDPHPAHVLNHRWTNYAVGQLRLFPGHELVIRETTYLQPRFDRPADLRVLQHVQLEARVSPRLAIGTEGLLLYDHAPPAAVQPLDIRGSGYVRLRFD